MKSRLIKYSGSKVITVSGSASGAGKTSTVERLLDMLKGWSCLKVTVLHDGQCPTKRNCGACAAIDSDFRIVSEKSVIEEKGKDTNRFKKKGAKKVLWLKAKPKGLEQGLRKALSMFKGAKGIIIEGTSVIKYIKPDFLIFVLRKGSNLKPSAKEILNKVDLILNSPFTQ